MKTKVKVFFLLSFSILLSLIVTNGSNVSASTIDPLEVDFDNLIITEEDGSYSIFDNSEDMEDYINTVNSINPMSRLGLGESLVGTQNKKMQFLSYSKYTPDWALASSYTLKKGNTYSFSSKIKSKWGNVKVSFSRKHGVNTKIPANAKKYSKLAGYADLKIQRIKVTKPNLHNSYYKTKVTKTNTYIKPKYK